jgi:CheY-like chemotaxis protein/HPt (histidine-containing phosphotransfer) domain-containing protein
VHTANDGQQALDRLRAGAYDCVLMDVQMPVMDGLQATRAIRADPRLAALPVVAMTANARGEDQQRCFEAGMDDFMTKPVAPEQLYAMVAKWMGGRADQASVDTQPAALDELPAVALPSAAAPLPEPVPVAPAATPAAMPTELAGNPELIDLSILWRAVSGNPDKLRRYAALFVEAIPESVAELDDALARADLGALADAGHRLKSSARMVGALGFAALCQSLEQFRGGGTVEQARAIVEKMPALLAAIEAEIGRLLDDKPPMETSHDAAAYA